MASARFLISISARVFAVVPIVRLCLWIGVMPQPLLDLIRPDVDAVVTELFAKDDG